MHTLLLTRSEVDELLDPAVLTPALRHAFIAYSKDRKRTARRVAVGLPAPGSASVLLPGLAPGVPAYTVKVHAKFPAERPAIRGILFLHALETGDLLAVMDSTQLTAVRTGLSGALAADLLARHDADRVAVVGAGVQGMHLLRSLCALRTLRQGWVYDVVPQRARSFARSLSEELGVPLEATGSLVGAISGASVVLSATWSWEPFILPGMLNPGTHVTTLGPDEAGKAEVAADVLQEAYFVCDDRRLAVEVGALRGVGLGGEAVDSELGEVLAGARPGRTSEDQITVYGGVGLPFQDAVAAWGVYEGAIAQGLGHEIDFLA